MADNAAFFEGQPVTHHAYVEREENAGKGLLRKLASRASGGTSCEASSNGGSRSTPTAGTTRTRTRRAAWGKKILHWSESPEVALSIMLELNDRYALDGRDANSVSGITWVLGRYDRAWGPERPVFGKIRYMTSDSTRRKLRLDDYLARYGEGDGDGDG